MNISIDSSLFKSYLIKLIMHSLDNKININKVFFSKVLNYNTFYLQSFQFWNSFQFVQLVSSWRKFLTILLQPFKNCFYIIMNNNNSTRLQLYFIIFLLIITLRRMFWHNDYIKFRINININNYFELFIRVIFE